MLSLVTTGDAGQKGGLATIANSSAAPAGSGLSPSVKQLSLVVLFALEPSPPPAASSPTLADERPREHSAPTCFNGARLLPLLPGVVYPFVTSESMPRRVPRPFP